jgi:hypothetical protein
MAAAGGAGHWWLDGAGAAQVGLGRTVARTTAHPLHTRCMDIFGTLRCLYFRDDDATEP